MRKFFAAGTIVALALALSASIRAEDDAAELAKLEGTWAITEFTSKGQKVPEDQLKHMQIVFAKDKTATMKMDGNAVDTSTFEIKSGEKPKHMDMKETKGENKDKVEMGIYELDGDTLKICSAAINEKRPTEFGSKEGGTTTLVILKRVKKE